MTNTKTTTAELARNGLFANLKILLAEDNEVNQLLIKGILRLWGLKAKIAMTGFEVLNLVENEEFDIILMDIQMPEKSGIEAAAEIRHLKDSKKRNVPIIALTANALKGEERNYRAAGMDDFLTKPFKEADLYEVIQKVLRKEGSFGRENEI
jgi:CheY-like chemotaxis protein